VTSKAVRRVAAFVALLIVVAAVAWTVTPFKDHGTECGSAVASAGNGVSIPRLPAVPSGAAGRLIVRSDFHVVCRQPARTRLELSGSVVVVAVLALAIGWRYPRRGLRSPRPRASGTPVA
jgi:hypothetical protein